MRDTLSIAVPAGPRLRLAGVAVLLVVLTAAALVASNGHPLAAVLPAAVALAAVAVWRLPLRYTAPAVLFLALLAHNPGGRPMMDAWRGPLYFLGLGLYDNLRLHTGVDFLRFNALEVLFVALAAVALARVLTGDEASRCPWP